MMPLTNGYYRSFLIQSEDWHAGVLMKDAFYRFLQFFPDGCWLWSNRSHWDFDFVGFVSSLDLANMRRDPKAVWPPTSKERDGGHAFEFGTFQMDGSEIVLSHY